MEILGSYSSRWNRNIVFKALVKVAFEFPYALP